MLKVTVYSSLCQTVSHTNSHSHTSEVWAYYQSSAWLRWGQSSAVISNPASLYSVNMGSGSGLESLGHSWHIRSLHGWCFHYWSENNPPAVPLGPLDDLALGPHHQPPPQLLSHWIRGKRTSVFYLLGCFQCCGPFLQVWGGPTYPCLITSEDKYLGLGSTLTPEFDSGPPNTF